MDRKIIDISKIIETITSEISLEGLEGKKKVKFLINLKKNIFFLSILRVQFTKII